MFQHITPKELVQLLDTETIQLLDVRSPGEYSEVHIPEATLVPLSSLPVFLSKLNTNQKIVLICHSGARSSHGCSFLSENKMMSYNLQGGMDAFEKMYPTRVVRSAPKKRFSFF